MASLEDRWVRGDMVTTYRVVTGHDKVDSGYFFNLVVDGPGSITRGVTGVFNIRGVPDRLEIRKNSFSLYVVTRQPEGVGAVMGFQLPDVADHVGPHFMRNSSRTDLTIVLGWSWKVRIWFR